MLNNSDVQVKYSICKSIVADCCGCRFLTPEALEHRKLLSLWGYEPSVSRFLTAISLIVRVRSQAHTASREHRQYLALGHTVNFSHSLDQQNQHPARARNLISDTPSDNFFREYFAKLQRKTLQAKKFSSCTVVS
jgi:hypothetical protein